MRHFQVSRDLDESFSSLSILGCVIFKSLETWMRIIFKSLKIGYVIFKSLKIGCVIFKSLKIGCVIFKSSRLGWGLASRCVRPALHSEARHQPARHSSRAASMLFWWQIRRLLSKGRPRWPVLIVIHVKVDRQKSSDSCCLVSVHGGRGPLTPLQMFYIM
jgi:hypothetical protein